MALQYNHLLFSFWQAGSGLDLLHLHPRPLDLLDDVLDGGRPGVHARWKEQNRVPFQNML